MASRAQLVEEVIAPALAAGHVVVSDRYLLANIVYKGSAGGLLEEEIALVGMVATSGLLPDLTIVLDIRPAAATARVGRGPRPDRGPAPFLSRAGPRRLSRRRRQASRRRARRDSRRLSFLSGAHCLDRCVPRSRNRLRANQKRG